jgi:hypothetical protein
VTTRQVMRALGLIIFYVLPWPLALGFAIGYYWESWHAANPDTWVISHKAYERVQQKYPYRCLKESGIQARDQLSVYQVEAAAFLGLIAAEKKWPESASPSIMERSALTSFKSNKGTMLTSHCCGSSTQAGCRNRDWADTLGTMSCPNSETGRECRDSFREGIPRCWGPVNSGDTHNRARPAFVLRTTDGQARRKEATPRDF